MNDVTNKFDDVIKATPHIVDFQKMSNEEVLEHYYLSVGSESLWDSRELIMKAIKEQNKEVTRSCSNCEKYGSMRCPNSFYCYSTENKPFFKPKHNGK